MRRRKLDPPSGMAPPTAAVLPDGTTLDLAALAAEICHRYRAEFPDEEGRYGDAGMDWCVHDNQHILNWAALDAAGFASLQKELTWLARVLEARDFPLDRLARDLEIAGEIVHIVAGTAGAEITGRLRTGAEFVRSRPSFLEDPP